MEKVKKHSTMIPEDSQALEKVNVELKREIEERVCTEKALKESEDLHLLSAVSSPVAIAIENALLHSRQSQIGGG